jgi:hypothetical protein
MIYLAPGFYTFHACLVLRNRGIFFKVHNFIVTERAEYTCNIFQHKLSTLTFCYSISWVRLHFVTPWAEYAYILLHHEPSMLTIGYRRSACTLIIFNAWAKHAYNLLQQNQVSAYTICYRMHCTFCYMSRVRLQFVTACANKVAW